MDKEIENRAKECGYELSPQLDLHISKKDIEKMKF